MKTAGTEDSEPSAIWDVTFTRITLEMKVWGPTFTTKRDLTIVFAQGLMLETARS